MGLMIVLPGSQKWILLLIDQNLERNNLSESSSEDNEEFKQPELEEVPLNWQSNWLGLCTLNPGIS